ncbi:hypothetical protein ASPCADRAFT_404674 [Aspergillus carbonarius ITEM 5010]|uniref:Uncharacterized protein n=1 Tax=Aspergillus carbonarius (strain ITEM 5010) TaxID=602072 RepID=A0A1R3RSQ4_ASPC5|nr:hypothetical protein ASPCADRAFT_404674 [Aspergillus carbonarius ITEM 5010]
MKYLSLNFGLSLVLCLLLPRAIIVGISNYILLDPDIRSNASWALVDLRDFKHWCGDDILNTRWHIIPGSESATLRHVMMKRKRITNGLCVSSELSYVPKSADSTIHGAWTSGGTFSVIAQRRPAERGTGSVR